ncbi:NAD(P)H-dependent oxidoreductase [Streptosporangium fragile]|uniref:NAD(P)H-dependent oxidoreductase n=1 Tax=Streptosporangium fragile TaxID=46186 RepID=A0ABN3WA17_9ACTN
MAPVPQLVFLSGSVTAGSKADRIAAWCAGQLTSQPVATRVFTGADLEFPFYRPLVGDHGPAVADYLAALERADGLVLVSPAYHGSVSGLLKNALDYVNELADARQPFFDGRAIGCVGVALGEQGATSTVAALRTIGHALRGWPTPLGVTLSRESALLDDRGEPQDERARAQLRMMLGQVVTLARLNARRRVEARPPAPELQRA